MKSIIPLVERYHVLQQMHAKKKINKTQILKSQIQEAKSLLNKLRVKIRTTKFQVSKPNSTNSVLKNYLKNELKKLESKKRNNIDFYGYYKHNSNFLDHLYFLRENKQLDLFSTNLSVYLDSEFYTSHDILAAEVLAYDLLTEFYKKEIKKLKRIESGVFNENQSRMKATLQWSASKTDFIELMYALKVSGAINFGNINRLIIC